MSVLRINSQPHRTGSLNGFAILTIVAAGILASLFLPGWFTSDQSPTTNESDLASVSPADQAATNSNLYSVTISHPDGPPRVDCGLKDNQGNAITVSCSTCHSTRKPNFENKTPKDLDEFHTRLNFSHGTVSCLSCHNNEDYDTLKLADGTPVQYTDVMQLCSQCHGPQARDYAHGAHGGMNGHWDLTRGPRERNNCVDCHNPHAPQFPKMQPTFKPKDRFLKPASDHSRHQESEGHQQ